MTNQIPLAFRPRPSMSLDDFVVGSNAQALAAVRDCLSITGEQQIFLSGTAGVGKTHLLIGLCELADRTDKSAVYLPLAEYRELSPSMLEQLENLDVVALDDIHAVAGEPDWEEGLFNLFNRAREKNSRLLFSANCGPAALPLQLADLRSRLTWGVSYQLQPATDQEKMDLLILQAERRGLELSREVAKYLMSRCPRDTASLLQVLDQLDHASLAAKRRLTVPFVREQIENHLNSD